MKVTLVSPQLGSKDTAKAKDLLEAQGFGVQLERCSESLNDWFECPFLRVGEQTYFGMDGITHFVSNRLAKKHHQFQEWLEEEIQTASKSYESLRDRADRVESVQCNAEGNMLRYVLDHWMTM